MEDGRRLIAENRRARFDYLLEETFAQASR